MYNNEDVFGGVEEILNNRAMLKFKINELDVECKANVEIIKIIDVRNGKEDIIYNIVALGITEPSLDEVREIYELAPNGKVRFKDDVVYNDDADLKVENILFTNIISVRMRISQEEANKLIERDKDNIIIKETRIIGEIR